MKTKYVLLFLLGLHSMINLLAQTPNDAQHPYAQILHSTTPFNYQYGIPWFQAVTLQNNSVQNNGYLSVDYIKLIEEDTSGNNEIILYIDNYNDNGQLNINEGGLYERFPSWYYNDSHILMTNSNRYSGFLTINVGLEPNKINHFWGHRQFCSYGKRHKVEIRVLISGDIALQVGMDYWSDSISTISSDCNEAFYSNWYGNSNDQYITITYPIYNQNIIFDRTDYGFYENGKFYLSKKIVDFIGGNSVAILCNETNWQPALMTLNNNYYEYNTKSNYYSAQYYCFKINPNENSFFIPHAILNNLLYPDDAVSNGQGGYNFYTNPHTMQNISNFKLESEMIIYPNPSNSNIFINTQEDIKLIEIYNTIGKLVFYDNCNNSSIDISKFNAGLYNLKITTTNGILFKKIIITTNE